ncbi:hypothetical protein GEMRC1_007539 [Eukaryota sp. GEM-RC1]
MTQTFKRQTRSLRLASSSEKLPDKPSDPPSGVAKKKPASSSSSKKKKPPPSTSSLRGTSSPECVVSSNKLLATSHDVSAVLEEGKNLPHLPPLLPLPPSFLYSIHPLQDLLHRFLNNSCSSVLSSVLTSSKLLALSKPNGGVRPIAVSELFPRIVARFLVKKLNSDVFRKSGQFGVSCPNGSEAIVHYLRSLRFSHPSSRIISVDIRNAFNCVDRIQMLKAVKQFPDLLPFFFWSYSTPSDLFFDNHCLSSSQGVRQGDPLGPFLYSLTTLPVLSWLNSLSGVSCVAYLDDTYIVIDSDVDSSDLLNQLSQKYADLGLDLNLDKTKIFATFDNFVALGSPIGDSAFENVGQECFLFP